MERRTTAESRWSRLLPLGRGVSSWAATRGAPQGFPDGGPADGELGREVCLPEAGAGLKAPLQDGFPEGLGRLIDKPAAFERANLGPDSHRTPQPGFCIQDTIRQVPAPCQAKTWGQACVIALRPPRRRGDPTGDRKSTRLNSSHGYISYAVFCLKKK